MVMHKDFKGATIIKAMAENEFTILSQLLQRYQRLMKMEIL
jgi:hypothetical protein